MMKKKYNPNREFKFRAWRENKEMIYDSCRFIFTMCEDYTPSDYIIMQYIGLNDKDNKKIYEGDILFIDESDDSPDTTVEVVWCPEFAVFDFIDEYGNVVDCHYENTDRSTVLGNIYENPELLKK